MKKLFTLLLAVILILPMGACAEGGGTMGNLRKGSLRCKTTLQLFTPTANGDTWVEKPMYNAPASFYAPHVWTDGTDIYYSNQDTQLVLNSDTWEQKVWNGYTPLGGSNVWTDGTNIYYSKDMLGSDYVLRGDTWEAKTWNGVGIRFDAYGIWSDGTDIYYSAEDGTGRQYVLNGNTWEQKVWNVPSDFDMRSFRASRIWSDGTNIYYSDADTQWVLNGDTWEAKAWNGLSAFYGFLIWTDGTNIYYSNNDQQYVLNGDTWEQKAWNGVTPSGADYVWSDGTKIYFTGYNSNERYALNPAQAVVHCNDLTATSFTAHLFTQGLKDGKEYTAEFSLRPKEFNSEIPGVIYKDVTFTGTAEFSVHSCEFTDLLPNTTYTVNVDLYPSDGSEGIIACDCEVTTLEGEIPGGYDRDSFLLGFASGLGATAATKDGAEYNSWAQGYIVGSALRKAL